MKLHEQQILPQARIVKVKIDLGAEEHTVTLELQTALTYQLAEAFGCRDLIYAGTVPRSGVEKMILEGSEVDCDIHLKHDNFAFQTVAEEMGKYVALLEGDGPKLRFHVKFKGYVITVADLIEHVRVDPLEVILKPAQIPLGLQEEGNADAKGSEESAEESPEGAAADEGAPLAPAAVMGGTHQKGKRGRRAAAPESKAEDPDFMESIQ